MEEFLEIKTHFREKLLWELVRTLSLSGGDGA